MVSDIDQQLDQEPSESSEAEKQRPPSPIPLPILEEYNQSKVEDQPDVPPPSVLPPISIVSKDVDGDLDFLDDEEEEDESVPSDDRSQEEMKAAPHKRASRIVYSQKTKDMMNSMLQRLLRENPSMSKKDISRAIFDHLREEGIGIGSLRSVQTWVYNNTEIGRAHV